jgi:hypothetical protein
MDCEIKLSLKVKGVEIELTPKDAQELYEALGRLVGPKVSSPIVIEKWRDSYPWWPYVGTYFMRQTQPTVPNGPITIWTTNSNKYDDGNTISLMATKGAKA